MRGAPELVAGNADEVSRIPVRHDDRMAGELDHGVLAERVGRDHLDHAVGYRERTLSSVEERSAKTMHDRESTFAEWKSTR
jgi:hypothetical protein